MKIFSFFCLLVFLNLCSISELFAQLEEKERQDRCKQIKTVREKPVSFWIESLSSPDLCALDAVAVLGPEAAEAVPALAKFIDHKDWNIQRRVFEALVKIADGHENSPAAQVIIQALAKAEPNSSTAQGAWYNLAQISRAQDLTGGGPLPGWPGFFPDKNDANFRIGLAKLSKPFVSPDGKTYSQSLSANNIGDATSWNSVETLARDPSFVQKYSDEQLLKDSDLPRISYVGKRKVISWKVSSRSKENPVSGFSSRLVVLLGRDKAWISEYSSTFCCNSLPESNTEAKPEVTEPQFTAEQIAFFDRAEAALENPPRTDFRRTVKLFQPLLKGMSQLEVRAYAGNPDEILKAGDNIMVAIYKLIDGSTILLRYSTSRKNISAFNSENLWTLEYGSHSATDQTDTQVFIK